MNKKFNYIIMVLVTIIIVGAFLLTIKTINLKNIITQKNSEINELKQDNAKLSEDVINFNKSVQYKKNKNELNSEKKYEEYEKISNQFVEIYSTYDIEKVKDKKDKLLCITNEKVANSIVPEDMIENSKKLKDGIKNSQLYSTDPTFKSYFDCSTIYKNHVTDNKVNYFAIVNYKTKSISGNAENTTYLSFTIESKDNKIQVTEYQVYYLK